jgi:hypothetical protein
LEEDKVEVIKACRVPALSGSGPRSGTVVNDAYSRRLKNDREIRNDYYIIMLGNGKFNAENGSL